MRERRTENPMNQDIDAVRPHEVRLGARQNPISANPSRRTLIGAGLIGAGLAAAAAVSTSGRAEVAVTLDGSPAPATLTDAARVLNESLFPGFRQRFIPTRSVTVDGRMAEGAVINTLIGGSGPPLMLIHGYPENHACWHKIAGQLAERFTVVLPDLRGYGDSSKPGSSPGHINYAKTAMGADLVQVMASLGFDRFQAVGHDRGGRVLQFMMTEHPEAVTRAVILDIIPTDLMYARTDSELARKYFWWFFHIQDAPLPETFMSARPEYYVASHFGIQEKTPGAVPPAIMADYVRTCGEPAAIHAVCEDFRAAAGIDSRVLTAARAAGRKAQQPLLTVWGTKSTVGQMFDVVGLWREEAMDVSGLGLPCGHLVHEEDPDGLLRALDGFLKAG